MSSKYKKIPNTINKSSIFTKGSLSGKDYSHLIEYDESLTLREMVEFQVGDSFLSEDFLTEDISNKYRFIKTGNLSPYRLLVDFSSTQYCKPNGKDVLEDEDILIAKDGGTSGLGEVSIYYKDKNVDVDYFSGEVLRIRVTSNYDKWFILAILKSSYFKEYLDVVTPGGSTLRHSKLLALDFNVPYPEKTRLDDIKYISLMTQNLVDKEKQMKEKVKLIDELLKEEIFNNYNQEKMLKYSYPKISKIKQLNRLDTGVYTEEYKTLENIIKSYNEGYFTIKAENISPGRTPDDYKYTDKKTPYTYLWITPKNIDSLELLYETYINTKAKSKVSSYDIILSGIRYVGYGYFVDKDNIVYCNQNTLIVSHSKDLKEQIYLLAFLTSSLGEKLQLAWRVDGMVPIIYKDDLAQIPIPKLVKETKSKIVGIYYNSEVKTIDTQITKDNYLEEVKKRNKVIGIYQLNNEILELRNRIDKAVEDIIFDNKIEQEYFL